MQPTNLLSMKPVSGIVDPRPFAGVRSNSKAASCPVCGAGAKGIGYLYDDRYGYPGEFELHECRRCGHCFLDAQFSSEELVRLYSDYYPRGDFDVEQHKPPKEQHGLRSWWEGAFSSTFRWVPSGARVLDIGCGFGESLGYYEAHGCDAWGVEADENVGRVAGRFGYKVHLGLFDPSAFEAEYFDYVTAHQVIEHIANPLEALRGIATLLKPGAMAILSTPNPEGAGAAIFRTRWINWHAPYHLNLFTRRSMRRAAGMCGLEVERIRTITSSEWLFYQWIHLITRPAEGEPSTFWKPGERVPQRKRALRRFPTLVHRSGFDHVITRALDMAGLGDNQIFFLRKPD